MAEVTDTFYKATGAIHGYGGQWLIGNGASPEVFEAVANVVRIVPGDMTTAVIDRTHLRSPAAHREKMAGLRDSGPIAMEVIYDPTHESHTNAGGGSGTFQNGGIFAMWIDRLERNHIIRLNDGSPATEVPFSGIITKCQLGEIGPDDKIMLNVEVTPVADFSSELP